MAFSATVKHPSAPELQEGRAPARAATSVLPHVYGLPSATRFDRSDAVHLPRPASSKTRQGLRFFTGPLTARAGIGGGRGGGGSARMQSSLRFPLPAFLTEPTPPANPPGPAGEGLDRGGGPTSRQRGLPIPREARANAEALGRWFLRMWSETYAQSADVREIDQAQERLCYTTFHDLVRQVSMQSPSSASLLTKVWDEWHDLIQRRVNFRVEASINVVDSNYRSQAEEVKHEHAEKLRASAEERIRVQVDLWQLQTELAAKEGIITAMQDENDRDLLYSNQMVCEKELNFLRLDRETSMLKVELQKAREETALLKEQKVVLEDQVIALEDDKEDLANEVQRLQLRPDQGASAQHSAPAFKLNSAFKSDAHGGRRDKACQTLDKNRKEEKKPRTRPTTEAGAGDEAGSKLQNGNFSGSDDGEGEAGALVPPGMLHLISPRAIQASAAAAVAAANASSSVIPATTQFRRSFPRKQLLQWLHQLCVEKREADADAARYHRPPREMADFVFDFYLTRHGTREVAELDLLDLFSAMDRCADSPRVALFSMFLNKRFDLCGPFPANAVSEEARWAAEAEARPAGMVEGARRLKSGPSRHEQMRWDVVNLKGGLGGGLSLTQRTSSFYLQLLHTMEKHGSGPFRNADAESSTPWAELQSVVDLLTLVCKLFPLRSVEKATAQIAAKAITSKTLFERSGMVEVLDGGMAQFVNLDSALDIAIDCFLQEDHRLHTVLYATFLEYDPKEDTNIHKRSENERPQKGGKGRGRAQEDLDPALLDPTSLTRFSAVVRQLENWDQNKLLRVYTAASQLSRDGPVSLDDVVLATRQYGVMNVKLNWMKDDEFVVVGEAEKTQELLDVPDNDVPREVLLRRVAEMRDTLGSLEEQYKQQFESITHDQDVSLKKMENQMQKDKARLEGLLGAESGKSKAALAQERMRAAQEYNELFDLNANEIDQLRLAQADLEARLAGSSSSSSSFSSSAYPPPRPPPSMPPPQSAPRASAPALPVVPAVAAVAAVPAGSAEDKAEEWRRTQREQAGAVALQHSQAQAQATAKQAEQANADRKRATEATSAITRALNQRLLEAEARYDDVVRQLEAQTLQIASIQVEDDRKLIDQLVEEKDELNTTISSLEDRVLVFQEKEKVLKLAEERVNMIAEDHRSRLASFRMQVMENKADAVIARTQLDSVMRSMGPGGGGQALAGGRGAGIPTVSYRGEKVALSDKDRDKMEKDRAALARTAPLLQRGMSTPVRSRPSQQSSEYSLVGLRSKHNTLRKSYDNGQEDEDQF